MKPYEIKPMVKSAVATEPDSVRVELTDARVQQIHIRHLNGPATDISVDLRQYGGGQMREEHAGRND